MINNSKKTWCTLMHTKELLLLILICCVVTKNDADEAPILDNYENIANNLEGADNEDEKNNLTTKY